MRASPRSTPPLVQALMAGGVQPGPPDAPEQQALAGVYDAAVSIASGAATILVQDDVPPSPNCQGG